MFININTDSKIVRYPQYLAALAATGGAFAIGTILGWPSPSHPHLVLTENEMQNERPPPRPRPDERDVKVNPDEFAWIVSAMTLGAAFSCIPTGLIINWVGRKKTLLILILPLIAGWVIMITADKPAVLYAGRAILGVIVGANCIAIPVYNNEIAQNEIRGAIGSLFQVMINVGILFVYSIGYALRVQVYSLISFIMAMAITSGLFVVPESPVYLVQKKKYVAAEKAIKWLRGNGFDGKAEVDLIKEQMEQLEKTAEGMNWKTKYFRRSTLQGLSIVFGLVLILQMTGINAIIFYSTEIFTAAQVTLNPVLATVVIGVIQIIASIASTCFVDRIGRRILLIISVFFVGSATVIISVYFELLSISDERVEDLRWLPIFGFGLFVVFFNFGIGPITWIMMGELFAADVRGMAASLASTLNFLLAFVVAFTFRYIRISMGIEGAFWIYSGFGVLGLMFVVLFVPETKGKSIDEIQTLLSSGKIFMFG